MAKFLKYTKFFKNIFNLKQKVKGLIEELSGLESPKTKFMDHLNFGYIRDSLYMSKNDELVVYDNILKTIVSDSPNLNRKKETVFQGVWI